MGTCAKFHESCQAHFEIVVIRSPSFYVLSDLSDGSADMLIIHYKQLKPGYMDGVSDPVSVVRLYCFPIVG